jgi:signal peptidase II
MRMLKWLWLSGLVIALDLASKALMSHYLVLHEPVAIIPGFNLTLMHNPGAAFSFLRDASGWQRWFFTAIALTVSVGIVVWLRRLHAEQRWLAAALALILGGALGNVWDRVTLGYVVDFIEVYYRDWYWPAFNVADSAISVGAVILVLDSFHNEHKDGANSKTGESA